MEADRVDNGGLYDLHAREHTPRDCYRLVGVTVGEILCPLRVRVRERERESVCECECECEWES